MIRQITLMTFKADTGSEQIEAMGRGFAKLPNIVPGIRRFEFGSDIGLEDTTMDYALVIDFDSTDAWKAYRVHPDHVAFAQRFLPLFEDVRRVQYQID